MSIPKIIWQTHVPELADLPAEAAAARQSWIDHNPNYEIRYVTNESFPAFIQEYYGDEWLAIYNRLDRGIQRADVWRFMVIHQFGGVYVDLDLLCRQPIDNWLKPECEAIFSVDEGPTEIAAFIFAAAPGHPVLKSVLETIKNNVNSIPLGETIYPYRDVGTMPLTEGVKSALGITGNWDLFRNVEVINENPLAKEWKLHCYGNRDSKLLHKYALSNLMGRTNWFDGKYDWLKDMGELAPPRN